MRGLLMLSLVLLAAGLAVVLLIGAHELNLASLFLGGAAILTAVSGLVHVLMDCVGKADKSTDSALQRWLAGRMSKRGLLVRELLGQASWQATTLNLVHEPTGLALRVGMGFWQFDINDQDYLRELTLVDRVVLWPMAREVRDRLRYGAPAMKAGHD